jgi:hypothetical protein
MDKDSLRERVCNRLPCFYHLWRFEKIIIENMEGIKGSGYKPEPAKKVM